MDPLALAALVTALTSAVLGAFSFRAQRRQDDDNLDTVRTSAAYQELAQALTAQREVVKLYREEFERAEVRFIAIDAKATALEAKATQLERAHDDCQATVADLERRLRSAEARIAELGG